MADRKTFILYVDDDAGNRIVFEQSFVDEMPILLASSGAEALAILREDRHEIGVVVSDQRMPGMQGNELLRHVKDQYPGIVRMVMTAYSDLDAILGAVNKGLVARYIVKPWDAAEVRQMLRWGVDAFALGLRSEALQARLLEVERVATIGTVASAILHDVHGPLGYLSLNAERLTSLLEGVPVLTRALPAPGGEREEPDVDAARALVEELPEIVAEMETGCAILRDTLGEVRRLLYAESGGPQRADPIAAVRYALSVTRDHVARARSRLSYDGPDELPDVALGFASLVRVLINVITNAAEAVEGTGERGYIRLDASLEGREVRLRVRDDGPGMSEQTRLRVGTPLFTTKAAGTGLGISQCQRLIAAVGGRIDIDSTVGVGTTVVMWLPRATG